MASKDQYVFTFLRLPAEVRNIIYRLVCSSERGYISVCRGFTSPLPRKRPRIYSAGDNALCQGLLQSCRQIQAEAGVLYWSLNEFMCDDTGILYNFLKEIGQKRRRQIRSLSVLNVYMRGYDTTEAFKYMHAMTNLKNLSFYFFPNRHYPHGMLETLSKAAKAALFRLRGLEQVRIVPRPSLGTAVSGRVVESNGMDLVLSRADADFCTLLTQPRQTRQG